MSRRRLAAWVSSLPLMVVGSQCAHALAYRLAYPNSHLRLGELLLSGHSYMVGYPGYLPALMATIGAIEFVALGWLAVGSIRPGLRSPVPAWAFALLPLLGFTLQEVLERLLASGHFPWWVALTPTFRLGLLLQLPFALAAYVLARALLRVADRVGTALRPSAPHPPAHAVLRRWVVPQARALRVWTPASGHSGRGPPTPAPAASAIT